MRVALVHDYLLEMGGAERVLQVLAEIFPEAPIYTLLYEPRKIGEVFNPARVNVSKLGKLPGFLRRRQRWLMPMFPVATETINLRDFDLVISSSSAFIKGIITRVGTVHISYCHTPPRYLWDLYHFYAESSPKLNWLKKPILHYLRLWDLAAAGRVDYFIANSRNTARRIKKYYNRDSVVIYPPVDSRADYSGPSAKEKSEIPFGDYYLIISRLLSYKRIDLAVDVFNRLNLPLVIIGDGPERRGLERRAAKNIKFLGAHYGKTKYLYLKHCKAFIFPGDEDFGIAPVEAMMLGRPVLAFRSGGLLETVIEGKTGEFFDRQSSDSLLEGFERLQSKNYDPEFIKNHAKQFSKERFVKEIKAFVDEVLNLKFET